MKKKILIVVIILLAAIQFIRPARNLSATVSSNDISKFYHVPANVSDILQRSCNDCHSNNTVYPWYSNIQPVGWWLQNHINEGKKELNLSEFGAYTPKRQDHKMEEFIEMVEKDEMPLNT